MHPLVGTSKNIDKLHAATEWAVELGGHETHVELWRQWDENFKYKFPWVESLRGRIQYYGEMDPKGEPLQVKCNFLKVNDCVLMLCQPHGRFSAYHQMEKQVQAWLDNSSRDSITDASNFQNNQIWEDIGKEWRGTEEKSFPYGAQSAVLVEDEFHLNQFVEKARDLFKKRKVSFIRLPHSDIKEYSLDEADERKRPMYAHRQADLINGFVVTFFNNSGNFCDRQLLKEKAREWFPNAKQFVSKEELPYLLSMLGNSGLTPTAYQSLVKKLEEELPPRINLAAYGETEIPFKVVSSEEMMEEFWLEEYYQMKDPDYQAPQKLLCDRYLRPRISVLKTEIFPAIKVKMNESRKRGFKAEIQNVSVLAYQIAGRIMVTLRENGSEDYISLLGSDNVSTVGEMGIHNYYGNLPNLVNMLDVISQNWDIEKFKEHDEISMG